ncbi:ABC transporter ATP-binding protein [Paractinoplanes brasiliensis]|uniref:ABC-2 type transport system ATP-binding protein n=1 Tax=Paractinoplanes brasiliensis TaxID=52695 RepID=A0A4R6JMP6_9ACTN|nr:ABC transporter ATP-binding protein [Actinoplanes brasiliensis]TDO37002.1 ABC-2 type transport system ATP-binding protein [Actinoplanes brasiliensis]GID30525.1 multidrug ABC transporter ATP-binding protein [Actinoplanes brasiliensis]
MTPESVITCTGLRSWYGRFEAVRGIDLAVRPGELFALLGTNGAGKTTTLETLQGHRRPGSGSVRVLGLDPRRHRRQLASKVGVVLQESGFAPDLTVAETVRMWRRLRRLRDDPRALDELLREVMLIDRADIRVGQLSGGERRRLDLAVGLTGDQRLLFLDEPTTGLDPQSRQRTWDVVRDRLRRGMTVLLTTHYLEEAEALADRVAIMDAGRIVATGTVEELAAQQPARIHCTVPAGLHGATIPGLSGEPAWTSGTAAGSADLTIVTSDLQADLARLSAWAAAHDAKLGRLQAAEASLTDIFQRITGVPS